MSFVLLINSLGIKLNQFHFRLVYPDPDPGIKDQDDDLER